MIMLENKRGHKLVLTSFVVISLLLLIPLVYANFLDTFREGLVAITGRSLQTASTDVTISIGDNAPVIGNVSGVLSSYTITTSQTSNTTFTFSFMVTDQEGADNINVTSARANITNGTGGGLTRYNDTNQGGAVAGGCVNDSNNANNAAGNAANFSCTFDIVYYDTSGTNNWNVSVFVEDNNQNAAQNNTITFSIAETTSLAIQDATANFPTSAPDDENVTQTDVIALNNTGNDPIGNGQVNVTAVQIHGDSAGATFIPAENFTISTSSGVASCDFSVNTGVYKLVNKSDLLATSTNSTNITAAHLPTGPFPANEELLYLCLIHIPSDLTGQTYSLNVEENWDIIIH